MLTLTLSKRMGKGKDLGDGVVMLESRFIGTKHLREDGLKNPHPLPEILQSLKSEILRQARWVALSVSFLSMMHPCRSEFHSRFFTLSYLHGS
jgi:hypothetical protein